MKQLVNAGSSPPYGPVPLGASFYLSSERELCLARNHPDLVRHIPEILSIWRANMEAQAIVSWEQLINYILKYTLKPEERSTYLNEIISKVGKRHGDDAPVKKFFQSVLINTITERDISVNEACLILRKETYVEYSLKARYANVEGMRKLSTEVAQETDLATESNNWQESYWNRETNENFIKLCARYPHDFKYKCDPVDISLRGFMTDFSKDWVYLGGKTKFVPVIIPIFRYPVSPKEKKNFELYCKTILLSEKPGCYPCNVGVGFENFKEELMDFVNNSPFCPQLIKEEFERNLNTDKKKDGGGPEEEVADGDDFDDYEQLFERGNTPGMEGNASQDSIMAIHGLGEADLAKNMQDKAGADDGEGSDYDAEEFIHLLRNMIGVKR